MVITKLMFLRILFMACRMGTTMLQSSLLAVENQISERSPITLANQNCCSEPSFIRQTSKIGINFHSTRHQWRIAFALDTGGVPDNGGQEGIDGNSSDLNRTRLGRIIFLLLLGFYTANALATILGQTGDWDVLVAEREMKRYE
ncbi:Protein of unknown function D [Prunus dulcis]|uniref:Uncharacterized protein n=1 Tax=Prunus dulcis TaxID=3755 RepID=A0A4Y1RSV8_PRUDU|nr:Protein of unknown function D [Prunus dulcis]